MELDRNILLSILDNLGEGVVVTDTQPRLVFANLASHEIMGKQKESGIEREWSEAFGVFREDQQTPLPCGETPLARALRGEESTDTVVFLRRADLPEGRFLSIVSRPLKSSTGKIIGALGVFRDITTQKKYFEILKTRHDHIERVADDRLEQIQRQEEQLRQLSKMEAMGQLAGGVAHDFNNILGILRLLSEQLQLLLGNHPKAAKYAGQVAQAVDRGANLTRQLLTFSRKQSVSMVPLELNRVVTDFMKMLGRLIGENIKIVTHLESNLSNIEGDASQFEQIVMNLAVNGRDAMPDGGTLTIETRNVDLDADFVKSHLEMKPGPHVMLAVMDTGFGMDKNTQKRIFEPFFTTKAPGKGTGLGLSTVFGIVRQHGGTVWVYSEEGRGTTFKLYFPATERALISASGTDLTGPLTGTETILLAEDEPIFRGLTESILQQVGYRVMTAPNGAEALEMAFATKDPIHLVLTDVVMPELGGLGLVMRLLKQRPDLKILFLTGYLGKTGKLEEILQREPCYLQKPFSSQALLKKVREVLDGRGES